MVAAGTEKGTQIVAKNGRQNRAGNKRENGTPKLNTSPLQREIPEGDMTKISFAISGTFSVTFA